MRGNRGAKIQNLSAIVKRHQHSTGNEALITNWKIHIRATLIGAICALSMVTMYAPESAAATDGSTMRFWRIYWGDIDYWKASYWKDFVGVTVRTYDAKTAFRRRTS
jgi:hypothetical protein